MQEGEPCCGQELAEKEYEEFRIVQDKDFESDFDREVKKIRTKDKK